MINQIAEIPQLTQGIDGGQVTDWSCASGWRYDCWLLQPVAKAMPVITRNIERRVWHNLMQQSGMLALMNDQSSTEWYQNMEDNKFPEISEENILATFQHLHDTKAEVFERGVINVFKGISWDYRSNSLCKFGRKLLSTGWYTMADGYSYVFRVSPQ
ncbi:DUF4942 domain-containing protein [Klebsiella grimontii]|uniref:DUF4942 domain-containing protein n=1 Tax=Klebsiella grimontii TaxID=2058152 RepID=UPI001CD00096|nr:DUF4942 domain-containing protein [Klebsiella grimontii]